ncbi:hypothetical protein Z043_113330 [Scleropages formosus]|uniref:Uncharacterized protein n=1 Tax=Scleropages formosus TaxID=113540 RepID=A0A0P7V176_SCLFO|nr:hypothetical protein Z043_113330 [Scleropages formosus]
MGSAKAGGSETEHELRQSEGLRPVSQPPVASESPPDKDADPH